jgi:hypothetical protein
MNALNAAKLDIGVALGAGIPGAVFLVAGIIMFVVGGNVTKAPEKAASKLRVLPTPWVGPQSAGMGFVGTF